MAVMCVFGGTAGQRVRCHLGTPVTCHQRPPCPRRASTLSTAVSSLSSTGMSFSRVDEKEKRQALEEEQARLQALKVGELHACPPRTPLTGGRFRPLEAIGLCVSVGDGQACVCSRCRFGELAMKLVGGNERPVRAARQPSPLVSSQSSVGLGCCPGVFQL